MKNLLELVEKSQLSVWRKEKELSKEDAIKLIEIVKVCSQSLSEYARKHEELSSYIVYIDEIDINTMDMIGMLDAEYFKQNYIEE